MTSPSARVGRIAFSLVVASAIPACCLGEKNLDGSLIYRSEYGNVDEVVKLLDQGANVNATNESGETPLLKATERGRVKLMRLLIERGANVNAKTKNGQTILGKAAESSGGTEAVKMLLDANAELDPQALARACSWNKRDVAILLLDAGIEPDAGLSAAADCGHTELVRILLDRGANVNRTSQHGTTALHSAASSGSISTVELLLEWGANVNATDIEGDTPLHRAVSAPERSPEVVKRLVQSGASINFANKEGITPVRYAGKYHMLELYDLMVASYRGMEPAPVTALPRDPIDAAMPEEGLIAGLMFGKHDVQTAAIRELTLRGKKVMPAVLKSIESGTDIFTFYELFATMGPQAEAAIPSIERELKSKVAGRVVMASMMIASIHPRGLDRLDEPTRVVIAEALYEGVVDPNGGEGRGIICAPMLMQLGDSVLPTILRLLRHDDLEVRAFATRSLPAFPNPNETLQAELIQMLDKGQHPYVRVIAAEALADPKFHSPAAKAALMESFRNPPGEKSLPNSQDSHGQDYLWQIGIENFERDVPAVIASYGPEVIDECVAVLRRGRDDPDWKLYNQIWDHVGYRGVPRLRQLLDDQDKQLSEMAYERLGLIAHQSPEAKAVLTERLQSPDKWARLRAARALLNVAGWFKDVLPPHFIEFIGDSDFDYSTRFACTKAALSLAPVQTKASDNVHQFVPKIVQMAEKGEFGERLRAIELLGDLGHGAMVALPTLQKMVSRESRRNVPNVSSAPKLSLDFNPGRLESYTVDSQTEFIQSHTAEAIKKIEADK
jgi:ankyrin repeat protein/HEAT repeat protein